MWTTTNIGLSHIEATPEALGDLAQVHAAVQTAASLGPAAADAHKRLTAAAASLAAALRTVNGYATDGTLRLRAANGDENNLYLHGMQTVDRTRRYAFAFTVDGEHGKASSGRAVLAETSNGQCALIAVGLVHDHVYSAAYVACKNQKTLQAA